MMEKANIFFLDLNPKSGISGTLSEILESVPNLVIQRPHESVKEKDFFLCNRDVCGIISGYNPDIILLALPPKSRRQTEKFFKTLNRELSGLPIIIVIEECQPQDVSSLLKLGVADFITTPLKSIDILPRLWRLLERMQQEQTLTHKLKEKLGLKQLVGESPVFLEEINKIPTVAKCDASVLISGETGTGKELFARAIHYLSPRASQPFVPFNCGAIPTDLMENELFGHVQGAFTGATATHPGLIQEAGSGTLFLDDIDCLSPLSQAKLLRFLQEKEYRQLGSSKMCQADVRVITATNIELEEAVEKGKLRQDLYYRLNIIPLTLPSLKERREDIPLLARHFLGKYAIEFKKEATDIAPDAMQTLMLYDWPGNVRELEHVVERAVLFSEHTNIRGFDITLSHKKTSTVKASFKEAKTEVVNKFERNYIESFLQAHQGNITKAAQAAQKNRRAFWQLIQKHQIDVQTFKTG